MIDLDKIKKELDYYKFKQNEYEKEHCTFVNKHTMSINLQHDDDLEEYMEIVKKVNIKQKEYNRAVSINERLKIRQDKLKNIDNND